MNYYSTKTYVSSLIKSTVDRVDRFQDLFISNRSNRWEWECSWLLVPVLNCCLDQGVKNLPLHPKTVGTGNRTSSDRNWMGERKS